MFRQCHQRYLVSIPAYLCIQITFMDLETHSDNQRVIVGCCEHDSLLTLAFHDSSLIQHAAPFVQLFPRLCDRGAFAGRISTKCLVLSLRFSPVRAAALFMTTTLAAVLSGIIWGILVHSLELGLSIFAAILGVMSVLQGCVLWLRG